MFVCFFKFVKLVQESGPSHFKNFITRCVIENKSVSSASSDDSPQSTDNNNQTEKIETTGEGHSKKLSKHDSADKMLKILNEKFSSQLLQSLQSAPNSGQHNNTNHHNHNQHQGGRSDKQATQTTNHHHSHGHLKSNRYKLSGEQSTNGAESAHKRSKKSKNIEKTKKISPDYGKGSITPISRLMQIQQAKKENEPIFELIGPKEEANDAASELKSSPTRQNNSSNNKGRQLRPEFMMQVSIVPKNEKETKLIAEGKGPSKKVAKQNAAEAMLIKLGYQSTQQQQQQQPQSQSQHQQQSGSALKPSIRSNTIATINANLNSLSINKTQPINTSVNNKNLTYSTAVQAAADDKDTKGLVKSLDESSKKQATTSNTPLSSSSVGPSVAATINRLQQIPKRDAGVENGSSTASKLKIRSQASLHSQGLRTRMQNIQQSPKQLNAAQQQQDLTTTNSTSSSSNGGSFDQKQLDLTHKLSFELLDALKTKQSEVKASESSSKFYAKIVEELLKANNLSMDLLRQDDFDEQTFDEFNILNNSVGGDNNNNKSTTSDKTVVFNYKKLLDSISRIAGFKVNYQSLQGVSLLFYFIFLFIFIYLLPEKFCIIFICIYFYQKVINTYASLSILPTPERQLSGQGKTHVESANMAAQNVLKYLASKHKSSTVSISPK